MADNPDRWDHLFAEHSSYMRESGERHRALSDEVRRETRGVRQGMSGLRRLTLAGILVWLIALALVLWMWWYLPPKF